MRQDEHNGGFDPTGIWLRLAWAWTNSFMGLGPGPELLASTDPQPRTVTINGEGPFGPLTELSYVIDMTDFRETADRPSGSLHVLTRALNARPTKQDFAKLTDAVEALAPGIDEV